MLANQSSTHLLGNYSFSFMYIPPPLLHTHTRTHTPHTHTHPTHTSLTVVTIGLERDYSVTEGNVQEVCAVLLTGSLERDAIVTLSTEDGSATNSATGTLYRILLGFLCNL